MFALMLLILKSVRGKRRDVCSDAPNPEVCERRKRRDVCSDYPNPDECRRRKRRDACSDEANPAECRRRERRDACDACKKNPDSIACQECP